MPIARATSQELIPFLQLHSIQNAHIHLSKPRGESSKIVPTLSVNCFLHPEQNQMRRVLINECFSEPQRGQGAPFSVVCQVCNCPSLSSRPERTRISCLAALDRAA